MANRKRSLQTKTNEKRKRKIIQGLLQGYDIETADECILREVLEETGLTLTNLCKRGKVYFYSDMWEDEIMYLYTASRFRGKLTEYCNEGELKWIPVNEVMNLNLWEGDRIFLRQLADGVNDICLSVRYEGDTLAEWKDMRNQSI